MQTKDKNILDSVIYNYTANLSQLEEESRFLKETKNRGHTQVAPCKRGRRRSHDADSLQGR